MNLFASLTFSQSSSYFRRALLFLSYSKDFFGEFLLLYPLMRSADYARITLLIDTAAMLASLFMFELLIAVEFIVIATKFESEFVEEGPRMLCTIEVLPPLKFDE